MNPVDSGSEQVQERTFPKGLCHTRMSASVYLISIAVLHILAPV